MAGYSEVMPVFIRSLGGCGRLLAGVLVATGTLLAGYSEVMQVISRLLGGYGRLSAGVLIATGRLLADYHCESVGKL